MNKFSGHRILLVEDSALIRKMTEDILSAQGYEVLSAKDGQEAIKFLTNYQQNPPDLIISDIVMPIMDGYDFFNEVSENQNWNDIPFIFLSSKASPDEIRFGKRLGADDYITKPFDELDLLASVQGKIKRKLKSQKSRKQYEEKLKVSNLNVKKTIKDLDFDTHTYIIIVDWDDVYGPFIKYCHPDQFTAPFQMFDLSGQLYNTAVAIFGQDSAYCADSVRLRVHNINEDAILYFDYVKDKTVRGGERLFMIACISPKINYLAARRIEEMFSDIATLHKSQISPDLEEIRKEILEIL
jgi:CheY-like chemotaxis protein